MDGSLIMSAHYNKQIHVTDIRAKDEKQVISLSGRPTSIAVPEDFSQSLLALTRNNDLAVIDLRQMTVRISLTDFENDFRVTADYSRCSLSVSQSKSFIFKYGQSKSFIFKYGQLKKRQTIKRITFLTYQKAVLEQ